MIKKFVKIISGLVIFMLTFTGCNTANNAVTNTEPPKDNRPLVLKMLTENGQLQNPQYSEKPEYNPVNLNDNRIKAIEFDYVEYKGEKNKVFAYYGMPENASVTAKIPGIVLVHGGGGTAFPEWVQKWVDNGYAAIAIDTEGNRNINGGAAFIGTTGSDPDNRYTGPSSDGFSSYFKEIEDQWMYHAVSAAITANSILQFDPRVDKTGITGISWGGIITSIAMGADERFSFAIPVYCSGFFREGKASFGGSFFNHKTIDTWDPSLFFQYVKANVLFLNSDHDGFNSLNATSLCHTTLKGSMLTVKPDLLHGHVQGWECNEIMAFADKIIGKKSDVFAIITDNPKSETSRNISLKYELPKNVTIDNISVYAVIGEYSYNSGGDYQAYIIKNDFVKIETAVEDNNGNVTFNLQENATNYYVNITTKDSDGNKFTISSPLIQLD